MEKTSVIKNGFRTITTKKEYMELRQSLLDSALLFFAYDASDEGAEDTNEWLEYLNVSNNKFKKRIDIVTFSNLDTEDKLLEVFLPSKTSELKDIEFPQFAIAHPHVVDIHILSSIENPYDLHKILQETFNYYEDQFEKEKQVVFKKIETILESYPVVIFIKGTPHDPFCKFSRWFIELLNQSEIRYKSFNVFQDDKIRGLLKQYSGFKTFPQIYINQKILGGYEILKELVQNNKFLDLVPFECKKAGATTELEQLIAENRLVLFAKGSAEKPACNNSKLCFEMLIGNDIKFVSVDLNKDEVNTTTIENKYI